MWGCQSGFLGQKDVEGEQVVAKVNDYEIFVSDFAYIADRIFADSNFYLLDASETKKEALEHLITRKVMVQEAQKQNFDKQKTFMKEIERYWEQALLKFLIKKKSEELSRLVQVDEAAIADEYNKRKRKNFAELYVFSDKTPALLLSASKDDFDQMRQKLSDKMISTEPAQWWERGELPEIIEIYLFSLTAGDISGPIELKSKWIVVRVLDVGEVEMPPLEDVSSTIKEEIIKKTTEKMLEDWITSLKEKAEVQIDYGVMEEIDLEKPSAKRGF
jgi:hypothetical protein